MYVNEANVSVGLTRFHHKSSVDAVSYPVKTGQLTPDRYEQAWPLIRELASEVSMESWCRFARAMMEPVEVGAISQGILVAERKRTIRGLVSYEAINDLLHGRALLLRNAVVLDLALSEKIAGSLHECSVAMANKSGCRKLFLEVTPQMAWIGDIWQRESNAANSLPVTVIQTASSFLAPEIGKIVSVTPG